MPLVKKVTWSNIINRISTIHQGDLVPALNSQGWDPKICFSLWPPKAHHVAALNGCHQDADHPGHDQTLSLQQEHFWWPGMASQMQKSLKSCTHCLQHEGKLSKVLLNPIVSTTPMDLLHVDFMSIKMTMEPNRPPKVTNVLVFQDHFMKQHYGIHESQPDHKDSCQVSVSGLHLDLWGPSQAPKQLLCELYE